MANRAIMKVPPGLRERARSGEQLGVAGPLWKKPDALSVLAALEGTEVVVLGGDVIQERNEGKLVHTYDSWHCEREDSNETLSVYASRSRDVARDYITAYLADDKTLFRLVITDEPTAGLSSA